VFAHKLIETVAEILITYFLKNSELCFVTNIIIISAIFVNVKWACPLFFGCFTHHEGFFSAK